MPTRSVAPHDGIIATLTFDGVGDVGSTQGETRNITGFLVTNNMPHPVWIQVEEELDKQRVFETVIQPSQTIQNSNIPAGQRPRQIWRTSGPLSPNWDGLNIRWREPA